MAMNLMGKFGVSAAFASIYVYTVEIFPTPIRSLALGSCSTIARFGAILSPFVIDLVSECPNY